MAIARGREFVAGRYALTPALSQKEREKYSLTPALSQREREKDGDEYLVLFFLFHAGFGDDLLLDVGGHDFVVAEIHREAAHAAGHAG